MASTRKRARTTGVSVIRTTKRPIDKELKSMTLTGLTATQQETVLKTTTFPCTIVGLRWSLTSFQDAGTGNARCVWAIVVVRDGLSASSMSASDGSDFYTPEQNVLAFGNFSMDNNVSVHQENGNTKTMRKLMGGDQLIFIAKGQATNTSTVEGIIQFFCKS